MLGPDAVVRNERRNALADCSRCVGHCAHDHRRATEKLLERCNRLAGRNRQYHRPAIGKRGVLRNQIVDLLWLYGEHDDVRLSNSRRER